MKTETLLIGLIHCDVCWVALTRTGGQSLVFCLSEAAGAAIVHLVNQDVPFEKQESFDL